MNSRPPLTSLIRSALQEDSAHADITTRALIAPHVRVRAQIIAKTPGVIAGAGIARQVFRAMDRRIRCTLKRRDGQRVRRGDVILALEGPARTILAAERTALNFLGHLSGIATLTRAFVDRVRPYRVAILDTRKTLPGLRALEKYAVRMGGGQSHRADLSEAVLIKTNHLRINCGLRNADCGMVIQDAIATAKQLQPRKRVEIEVTNLTELRAAFHARPHVILLDNWTLSGIRKAVLLKNSTLRTPNSALPLEVSGGVTLRNVRALAATGVERISIGRLTHSAPALDVSLQVQ